MVWHFGIDCAAHIGALNAKGKTVAVLGCGFNNIFPKENIWLFNKIIENGGAVITEYEPEVKARSNYFLERNRIVSGLSMGILVVEAKYRSGTSITAELARKQGRKVFCLSLDVNDKYEVGTKRLLVAGKAILVENAKDIISNFPFLAYKEPKIKQIEFEDIFQENIFRLLQKTEASPNEICKKLKINIAQVNAALSIMEMQDIIEKNSSGKYIIKEINNVSIS